ncbi:hypothetical protein [Lapidilactobacillus salsurivasis]
MPQENNYFVAERSAYSFHRGHYLSGAFVNANPEDMNFDIFQLYPLPLTIRRFNQAREKNGELLFRDTFKYEATLYSSSNKQARLFLEQTMKKPLVIMAEGAEFLDGVGNEIPLHTVRLIEATDSTNNLCYLLIGGRGALEYKSNHLVAAEHLDYDQNLFETDPQQHVVLSEDHLLKFALVLAHEYFDRHLTADDVVSQSTIFPIASTSFSGPIKVASGPDAPRIGFYFETTHKWLPVPDPNNFGND